MVLVSKEEGVRYGLYKGIEGAYMRESVYSTLRLGLYEPTKRALGVTKNSSILWKFTAGSIAGLVSSVMANPFDLLKIRMQASTEAQPISHHIKSVYQDGGIQGFWRGVGPTCIRAMMNNGTKLACYDGIKHAILDRQLVREGIPTQFVASVFAGFFQTVVTTPMDNIKTRVMNQGPEGPRYDGILDCAQKIIKNEGGPMAFYKGFGPTWARIAPFTTIQLVAWEALRKACGFEGI